MWNFKAGGGEPKLTFWREPGHEIIRKTGLERANMPLEKLAEYHGPFGWYLANGRVLHNVQDLIGVRVNLQIALTEDHLLSIA
jgi:hypothetical protein